jgi:ubiquinone/menaquinone biosynthesis C-methylase UbiE
MANLFSQRSEQVEIMDDLSCSGKIVDQSLTELDIINKWLGGNEVTINALDQLLKNGNKNKIISIADLGCGSGEMLRLVRQWGGRNGYTFILTGIDANSNIVNYARNHLMQYSNIELISMNVLGEEFKKRKFDIVLSTLFFHHFSSRQLIEFFKQLKDQVSIGFIINDIHRHWFAYHSIKLITKFFSRSPMVKSDAPLSVLRAFSRDDLITILTSAGIKNYEIRWRWAFRWQVIVFA